jgi:predicted membrane channel-forming protein YqfA (hemolysin III family)
MLVSLIFSICLLFLKRWAAIGFLVSVTFLAVAEMLLPNYFPQSTLEASFDAFSIMAYVSVLVIFALESKLKTFKA